MIYPDLGKILRLAEMALGSRTLSQMVEDGNLGGYLCVFDNDAGPNAPPVLSALVGKVDDVSRRGRYLANALDKGKRLLENHDHVSAWQSRDLNTKPKHYGGGIRAGNLVITFSGFPEHGDEVIVLIIAVGSGLLEEGGVQAIAEVSSNPLVPILLDELENELPF